MKLDRLNEYVLAAGVVLIGIVAAVMCGRFAGTGQNFWLWVLGAGIIYTVACLTLRAKMWLLVPMFWACSGQLASAPGHLPLRDLVVGGVVVFFFTLKAFKVIRVKPVYGWLDMIMIVNVLYIIALYLRYPIGVNAFGSEMVGGRPYMDVIFAVGAYWVLNQVMMSPVQAKIFPVLLCIVGGLQALLSTVTYLFPATVPILGKFYNGIDAESYQREQDQDDSGGADEGDERAQYLLNVGPAIINLMTCYLQPLTLINPMYIWRFTAMGLATYFCLKSGHRIALPSVAICVLLTAYFRKGFSAVIIMALIAFPFAVLLIAGQGRLYSLPQTAQRALSFLPGDWDPDVINSAEDSTQWRLQMWDMMLHDDRYIHDKVFGDGFGFTREVLERMATNRSQEDFMLTNSPHSGPVSTIRVGGYVGLGLFLIFLISAAVKSWQLIVATKGTPFYPASLFTGVQTIYAAFGFVFIFGDFKNDILNMILIVGLLNLYSRSFAAYKKNLEDAPPPALPKKAVQPFAPLPIPAPALH